MPLHALELLPDPAGQAAIRRDWLTLREAGLKSQLDHRGATNAPHLTLVAAATIDLAVQELAVQLLAPLLPIQTQTSGLLILGTRRLTLARAVNVDDQVAAIVLRLREAVGGNPQPSWLPHVTLARGLSQSDVRNAIEVLSHDTVELSLTELRRWDPDRRTVTSLLSALDDPAG